MTARLLWACFLSVLLAACGGGGGGTSAPAGPVVDVPPPPPLKYPIPAGMWSAPAGATPRTGNYIYLQSDTGDYIGGGKTYSYTNADTKISVATGGLNITVNLQGNESWFANFLLPSAAANLQAGYFQGLTRAPFADKAVGGIDWGGEGRGCNTLTGWVIIDKIALTDSEMTSLDLRFEQHCDGRSSALHGQIHWTKADANVGQPTAPQAIPAGLWQPAAGVVPSSGNYVYLESRQGDYIGAGKSYSYTQANAVLKVIPSGSAVDVQVDGDENWHGGFRGLTTASQLSVGYYAGRNPFFGGFDWSGEGRGCGQQSGWFVIDKISYNGAALAALDIRFELQCQGSSAPLRGQIHWMPGDTTAGPMPQDPPPAGLWKPDAAFQAPSGNYIYLVSPQGDYIGGGRTELVTSSNATITAQSNLTAGFSVSGGGWSGTFIGMNALTQLKPGYYANLQRYPFNNPVLGGMSWSGKSSGCNQLSGWFVVDKVSYAMAELSSIDLRFEQHCEVFMPALHGVVHWSK